MAGNAAAYVGTAAGARRSARRVPAWVVYLSLTLLLGVYQGINAYINFGGDGAWKPFVWELSSALTVLALLPLVVHHERRFPLDSRPRGRAVLAHAAGVLVFSVAHTTGMVLLRKLAYAATAESYEFGSVWVRGFYELQKDVILYAVILVVVFAVREFRVRRASELKAAELAAEVGEARLRHLTAQIEPHFLFNSLNAISNRMHEDVEAADRMVAQLGDLLRAAYETDESVLVPLERELAWLRNYTAMMAERFRGRLEHEISVEAGLDAVLVPRLLLQPLVENALKHGLREGAGRLAVTVRRDADEIEYTVSDNGAGLAVPAAHGTGLRNVARRLELLFPGEHVLTVAPGAAGGTTVTVRFPLRA